jgi:hypothetical protein
VKASLEHQAWRTLGDQPAAERALRLLAQSQGCELMFDAGTFVFFKERKPETIPAISPPGGDHAPKSANGSARAGHTP